MLQTTIIGQRFERRRCLAVLWWSCGGAAGSLTLWISGRWEKSLHSGGLIPEKRPCRRTAARKTNKCWHPNKTKTGTCWNSNSAVQSIKKNNNAFWENFSPLSAAKASSLPSADDEDVSLAVRLAVEWFRLSSYRRSDSLKAKPTENTQDGQTLT